MRRLVNFYMAFLSLLTLGAIVFTLSVFDIISFTSEPTPAPSIETPEPTLEPTPEATPEESTPEPIEIEPILLLPDEPVTYFALTDEERFLVGQVVMAESGGESYEGQLAVAQCILDAAVYEGVSVETIITEYRYTTVRLNPSPSVLQAVQDVFVNGVRIVADRINIFYSPTTCGYQAWHEAQTFVAEIGGHRFFWMEG